LLKINDNAIMRCKGNTFYSYSNFCHS